MSKDKRSQSSAINGRLGGRPVAERSFEIWNLGRPLICIGGSDVAMSYTFAEAKRFLSIVRPDFPQAEVRHIGGWISEYPEIIAVNSQV